MKILPHVASRVLDAPLLIGRDKLATILSVLGPRIRIAAPALPDETGPGETGPGEAGRARAPVVTPSGLAVIPVFGTLVKRAGAVEAASGLTAYAGLETAILDAATDPAVRAILLDVDSPGGEAAGVFDLADLVFEARALKPIWAIADEAAFSAAYAIASAAERVIVPRTGGVGSIGVVAVHVDRSARDAMEGLRYTTVFAGAQKADFDPHAALGDRARARLQAEVDRVYGLFVDTVARNRGLSAEAVRATEAGVFFGEDAVAAGLADAVGALRETLAALAEAVSGPRSIHGATTTAVATPPTLEEEKMNDIVASSGSAPQESEAAPARVEAGPPPHDARRDAGAAPDPGARAPEPSAEVVDLDRVRADARGAGYREAAAIADLCALAGVPERTAAMIARGLSADEARRELLALKARDDGPEVRSHVLPGAGTGPGVSLDDNPVVRAAKARAARA